MSLKLREIRKFLFPNYPRFLTPLIIHWLFYLCQPGDAYNPLPVFCRKQNDLYFKACWRVPGCSVLPWGVCKCSVESRSQFKLSPPPTPEMRPEGLCGCCLAKWSLLLVNNFYTKKLIMFNTSLPHNPTDKYKLFYFKV